MFRPSAAPPMPKEQRDVPLATLLGLLLKALAPPVFLIFSVLGSIFLGVASPSEAAGVGAFGATLLAAAYGKLNLATMREVCYSTAKTTAFIVGAIIGATAFAVVLRGVGGDQVIEEGLLSLPFGPTLTLIFILFIIFLLGFILDWIEITLIVLPLLVTAIPALGFDPLWFTILVAVCLQTSFLTPPVGFALFYMKSAAPPEVKLSHIYKGIIPFVILQLIGLLIVALFPETVTWLPTIAY
ncbi:MAG: TRAP transporter large permease subunit, partial [Alphaproteobacteria bacterium]